LTIARLLTVAFCITNHPTTDIDTLSLHDALPISRKIHEGKHSLPFGLYIVNAVQEEIGLRGAEMISRKIRPDLAIITDVCHDTQDRKSTRLNSSHVKTSYAVFCLKKKRE